MANQNQEIIENLKTTQSKNTKANETVKKEPTTAEIRSWLVSYLSMLLEMEPNQIPTTKNFDRFGLDSSATISLTSDLSDWLGREIDHTIVFDYPSIETLALHLGSSI